MYEHQVILERNGRLRWPRLTAKRRQERFDSNDLSQRDQVTSSTVAQALGEPY